MVVAFFAIRHLNECLLRVVRGEDRRDQGRPVSLDNPKFTVLLFEARIYSIPPLRT